MSTQDAQKSFNMSILKETWMTHHCKISYLVELYHLNMWEAQAHKKKRGFATD